jgi:hypothetical protein
MFRLFGIGYASVYQKQNIDMILKDKGGNEKVFVRVEGAYIEIGNS